MDSSHVALVNVVLKRDGFENYRCPRNLSLGIKLASMAVVLKSAGVDDKLIIKTDGDSTVSFIFRIRKG